MVNKAGIGLAIENKNKMINIIIMAVPQGCFSGVKSFPLGNYLGIDKLPFYRSLIWN